MEQRLLHAIGTSCPTAPASAKGPPGIAWIVCLVSWLAIARAQVPDPTLNQIWPPIVSADRETAIELKGADLDDPTTRLLISGREVSRPMTSALRQLFVPGSHTGFREVFASNRFGLSNPRRLLVSTSEVAVFPGSVGSEPPVLVPGRWHLVFPERRDILNFRLPPVTGRYRISVLAAELDSKASPVVSYRDPSGRNWRQSHRFPVIASVHSTNGVFSIFDELHRTGEGFGYGFRVDPADDGDAIGNDAPFPEGMSDWMKPRTAEGWREILDGNPFPEWRIPVEARGRFWDDDSAVGFRFQVSTNQEFWVELVSQRAGYPADPYVWIQRRKGTTDAFEDFREIPEMDPPAQGVWRWSSRDPAGRVTITEAGEYRVVIRNAYRRKGVREHFWLRMGTSRPTADIYFWNAPGIAADPNDQKGYRGISTFRAGEVRALQVATIRREGFGEAIELAADTLPPGWRAWPGNVAAEDSRGWLLIQASSQPSGGVISLRGRSAGGMVFAGQSWFLSHPVSDPSLESVRRRAIEECGVVSLKEPCVVEWKPVTNRLDVATNGVARLAWNSRWADGFGSVERCRLVGPLRLEKLPELSVPAKSARFETELKLADSGLPKGEHWIWIHGRVKGNYRRDLESLEIAEKELKSIEVERKRLPDDKSLESRQKEAAEKVKAARDRSNPREVNLPFWSEPILVRVGL